MTTWTALTTLSNKEAGERLGRALEALGPMGVGLVEVEDGSGTWEVGAYFEATPDRIALDILAAAFGAAPFAVSEVPETDWVAHVRRELAPVEAGRFFVHGAHDSGRIPDGSVALLIEAAMAFGTGHHATTMGCLRAIDRLESDGASPERIADIGCGTAVLAMAAARVWPDAEVVASDIDPVAVEVAASNIVANGLSGRVRTIAAAGFDEAGLEGPFDLVLANILKGPLLELAPAFAVRTRSGAIVILSGLLNEQSDEVVDEYSRHGFNLRRRDVIVDWTTLTLLRKAEV